MRSSVRLLLVSALAPAFLVVGCADTDDASKFAPAAALDKYYRDVAPLLDRIATLEENYAEVQGDNYTTDRAMRRVIQRDLPEWNEIAVDVASVQTADPEIEDAHRILIDTIQTEVRAMTLALAALEAQDLTKIAVANDEMAKARDLPKEYSDLLGEVDD